MTTRRNRGGEKLDTAQLLPPQAVPADDGPFSRVLDNLLRNRFQGRSNVRGVRYQLTYHAWRAFDLYSDDAPDEIVGEGLEDVDLRSVRLGNEYVQLKHLGRNLGLAELERILASFARVLAVDPFARFRIVTSTGIGGEAATVDKYVRGEKFLPRVLRQRLRR